MRTLLSTAQVAKLLGVMQPSLQRAISEDRIPAPKLTTVGNIKVRLWAQRDVERAKKAMAKSGKWGQLSRKTRTKKRAKRKT